MPARFPIDVLARLSAPRTLFLAEMTTTSSIAARRSGTTPGNDA